MSMLQVALAVLVTVLPATLAFWGAVWVTFAVIDWLDRLEMIELDVDPERHWAPYFFGFVAAAAVFFFSLSVLKSLIPPA